MKKLADIWLWLWCLPRSLWFNLKYLPLKQALRLPFWVGPRLRLAKLEGKVRLDTPHIYRGMIELNDVIIAWGCQISDSDWHRIVDAEGQQLNPDSGVEIGDHVWIATNVQVLRGSKIAGGCILATGAVVKGQFEQAACLLGGVPARVLKQPVYWQR